MALDQKDLELIERVIYKNGDDIAVSVSRSFERLEERIDAAESRLNARMDELKDRVEACEQNTHADVNELRDALAG